MKATSKAEARRRKGERSAAANISLATCDGQRSPRVRPKDPTLTVQAQRAANGVPDGNLKDQRAGWKLGLMNISGVISNDQYDAGIRYAEVRTAWLMTAIGGSINIQAQNVNRVGGTSGVEPPQEKIDADRAQHQDMMGVVLRTGGWPMRTELDLLLVSDEALPDYSRVMVGLTALAQWKDGR